MNTTTITDAQGRTWDEQRDGLWRSTDGKYVIVRIELPGEPAHLATVYLLRKIDPAMAKVYPGSVGYSLGQNSEHHDLDDAMRWADNDDNHTRHAKVNTEALDALPADVVGRFWWPISNGTTRGALTLTREGDRMVARVVGMSRTEGEQWEPGTYTEASLPLAVPAWRRFLRRHG
jgi:hypothetical protein